MADIFYTTKPSRSMAVTAVTSEATGFPIENALDYNPNTYWKPTSTASQTIDIDLGSAQLVDGVNFIIRNYDADLSGGSAEINIYTDDNDNGAYSAVTSVLNYGTEALRDFAGEPVYPTANLGGLDSFTSSTKRYWRITITGMTGIIEIACILFCNQHLMTQIHEATRNIERIYRTSEYEGGSGIVYSKPENSVGSKSIDFKYLLSGSAGMTDLAKLRAVYEYSLGRAYPVIFTDGTDFYYGKLKDKNLKEPYQYYQFLMAELSVIEIPHFGSGAAY